MPREAIGGSPAIGWHDWDYSSSGDHGASTATVADKLTEKVVGKPYWGKPDVRFDEGARGIARYVDTSPGV